MRSLIRPPTIRQISDDSLKRRKKYEEDLKMKRKELREEFQAFEGNNYNKERNNDLLFTTPGEIRLKSMLNSFLLYNNQKRKTYESLKRALNDSYKRSFSEKKALSPFIKRGSSVLTEDNKEASLNEYSEGFLQGKIALLKERFHEIEGKIVYTIGDKEALLQKQEELKKGLLYYQKNIEELGFLKHLAQKKFLNIDNISFKAKESKVSFLFIKYYMIRKEFSF